MYSAAAIDYHWTFGDCVKMGSTETRSLAVAFSRLINIAPLYGILVFCTVHTLTYSLNLNTATYTVHHTIVLIIELHL